MSERFEEDLAEVSRLMNVARSLLPTEPALGFATMKYAEAILKHVTDAFTTDFDQRHNWRNGHPPTEELYFSETPIKDSMVEAFGCRWRVKTFTGTDALNRQVWECERIDEKETT